MDIKSNKHNTTYRTDKIEDWDFVLIMWFGSLPSWVRRFLVKELNVISFSVIIRRSCSCTLGSCSARMSCLCPSNWNKFITFNGHLNSKTERYIENNFSLKVIENWLQRILGKFSEIVFQINRWLVQICTRPE